MDQNLKQYVGNIQCSPPRCRPLQRGHMVNRGGTWLTEGAHRVQRVSGS